MGRVILGEIGEVLQIEKGDILVPDGYSIYDKYFLTSYDTDEGRVWSACQLYVMDGVISFVRTPGVYGKESLRIIQDFLVANGFKPSADDNSYSR